MTPFHVRYEQTRRDRLAADLESWGPCLGACLGFTLGMGFLSAVVSPWFAPLLALPVAVSRRFLVGLIDLARRPTRPVDLHVSDTALDVEVDGRRTSLPLAGLIQVCKEGDRAWTLIHASGAALTVPTAAFAPEQLDYLRGVVRARLAARRG